VIEFEIKMQTQLVLHFSEFYMFSYEFSKFSTLERKKNQNLSYRPSERVESSQISPSAMAVQGKLGWAQIRRRKSSDGKGKGVGSERAPRCTRLKAWPGLGRLGRGSPA
jgi:hypothetical protein